MKKRTNVVFSDSTYEEGEAFLAGLRDITKTEWILKVCNSNGIRSSKWKNIKRYMIYCLYPLWIFFHRNKYNMIIAWQAFYGLLLAFYCRLFHVQKTNTLIIKNFTYKPKKGLVGCIYDHFLRYIVTSGYIDMYICTAKKHCLYCSERFQIPKNYFVAIPFAINDYASQYSGGKTSNEKFVLALGRSNRDWEFLINSLADSQYKVIIICDQLKKDHLPPNIEIINNVADIKSHQYIERCTCVVIPIKDGNIASGETVVLKAMSFGKPIIVTRPSCIAEEYVVEGVNGMIIDKNKHQLIEAIQRIFTDSHLYKDLSAGGRKTFLEKHYLYHYGAKIMTAYSNLQHIQNREEGPCKKEKKEQINV